MKAMGLKVLRYVLYSMAALTACGAAFVAGTLLALATAADQRPLEPTPTDPVQTKHARDLVEQALDARLEGDNRKAFQLFEEAGFSDPSLNGLDYQKGLALLQAGDFDGAEAAANASLAKKEETADAYALLIMCAAGRAAAGATTDPKQVADWAAKSREADPLAPFVYYARGEYARATGAPTEAVAHYRKALQRVSSSDSLLIATVKAGLSGLRLRQESDPKPVMPAIGDDPVPPEWLFFAAAQALLDGDKPTAQAFLERARRVVSPEIFSTLLQDSFFQDFLPENMLPNPQ